MSPELRDTLLAVASIVGALGGLGAGVTWWLGRHKPAIERGAAQDAREQVRSEIRTADIDGLRDIIASLREEVDGLRGRVETAEVRARSAEERATAAEQRAGAAERARAADARYIEVLVAHWPTPPPPPRPH